MKGNDKLRKTLTEGGKASVTYSWGEALWRTLYSAALYEESETSKLLEALPSILPCVECKRHYQEYVSKNPFPSATHDVFAWLYELERQVAKRKGKKCPDRYGQIRYTLSEQQQRKVKAQKFAARRKAKGDKAKTKAKRNARRNRRALRRARGCAACGG